MAIRIVKTMHLLAWMEFLVVTALCGCTSTQSQPATTPPAQTAQTVYPTIEEAALAAWDFPDPDLSCDGNPAPGKGFADRAGTLRLWQSKPELLKRMAIDLNGDGAEDALFCNAHSIDMKGRERSAEAGVGQWCLWAALEKTPEGWRVVCLGWGSCPPNVQDQTTNGWKNLTCTYHISAGQGIEYLYQFNGTRYKRTKETEYGGPPVSDDERPK